MKAYELISWLEKKYPTDAAEDWDNVGLLTGDDNTEVSHVFLALDLTEETLAEAIENGADMILTHHPMIFSGIKKINNHSFTGRRILTLIRKGIVYYAMHTNYDVLGMADLSADYMKLENPSVLSVTEEREGEIQGFGRVGDLPDQNDFAGICAACEEVTEIKGCKGLWKSGQRSRPGSSLHRLRKKYDSGCHCSRCRGLCDRRY